MKARKCNSALAAASRLIQENLDQPKDRELVERYLSGMGSGADQESAGGVRA